MTPLLGFSVSGLSPTPTQFVSRLWREVRQLKHKPYQERDSSECPKYDIYRSPNQPWKPLFPKDLLRVESNSNIENNSSSVSLIESSIALPLYNFLTLCVVLDWLPSLLLLWPFFQPSFQDIPEEDLVMTYNIMYTALVVGCDREWMVETSFYQLFIL